MNSSESINSSRKLKLWQRLSLGFAVLVLLSLGMEMFMASEEEKLAGYTDKLYRHPFTVSTSMLKINGDIVKMHRSMKDVALARNSEQISTASHNVDALEQQVLKEFALVDERFLGDKTRVNEARKLFIDWKPIRDEVISHMERGERDAAAAITKEKGAASAKPASEQRSSERPWGGQSKPAAAPESKPASKSALRKTANSDTNDSEWKEF